MHAAETARERIVDHGAECELIVSPDVAETFRTGEGYAAAVGEMVATGRLTVLEATAELPMCVGVIDDRVQIVAAEGDEPRALVESERREVYEWATRTTGTYRREAEPVPIAASSETSPP